MPRLDVRLDSERRRRLEELAEEMEMPISEVVRCLIDYAYEGVLHRRRREAVEVLTSLSVDAPPDPAALSRELEVAHESGGID